VSGAWPAFWHLLTWTCVAWYTFLTLYVAWRGLADIRGMLGRLRDGALPPPGGDDTEGKR
jgi:hypothetical protein